MKHQQPICQTCATYFHEQRPATCSRASVLQPGNRVYLCDDHGADHYRLTGEAPEPLAPQEGATP